VLASLLTLAGCSEKQLKSDDLKAEIKNAQQLSRECAMVLELRTTGKMTEDFRKIHELYLVKQFEELKKTADKAKPDDGIRPVFDEYKQKLSGLEGALRTMESEPHKEKFEAVTNDLDALEKKL
jgi:DNA polymerase/3'-5' exonuclease PolX